MITASPTLVRGALAGRTLPSFVLAAACLLRVGSAAICTAAIPPEFQSKLDHARLTLGISEASQRSIEHELERLRASDSSSAETVHQYEDYLDRVSNVVDRQRSILVKMEALAASMDPSPESETPSAGQDPNLEPLLPGGTDEATRLEQSFDASLYAFDAALMNKLDELARELEELSDAASDEAGSLASAIETARQRLEGQGDGTERAGEESGDGADGATAGEQDGAAEREGETASADSERTGSEAEELGDRQAGMDPGQVGQSGTDSRVDTGSRSGTPGAPGGSTSSGPTDYRGDDDIIARQLREAAEKETDPVLKEKLWDEYKRYKQSGTL